VTMDSPRTIDEIPTTGLRYFTTQDDPQFAFFGTIGREAPPMVITYGPEILQPGHYRMEDGVIRRICA